MKCFYHQDRDAVAICKSCHRAICMECAADVPPGVACRGKCEAEVAALNKAIEQSKTVCRKTGVAYRRNGMILLIAGLLFMGLGLQPAVATGDYSLALTLAPLGLLFILWAFFNYRSGKQISG